MYWTATLARFCADRRRSLTCGAWPALAILMLAVSMLPPAFGVTRLAAAETVRAVQPLKEAIRAGGSLPARFVLADGKTVIGHIVRAEDDRLLIRKPSGGLLPLPLIDIVAVNLKAADGALRKGKITRLADGGIGWQADDETVPDGKAAGEETIAGVEALPDDEADTGGPLIPLDNGAPGGNGGLTATTADEAPGAETVPVALEEADSTLPSTGGGSSATVDPLRLTVTADEAKEGEKLVMFRLALSEPAARSVLIIYTLIDGTADAPGDYTHRQGVVVFEPGQSQAAVAVPIVDDESAEGAESFALFVTADPAVVEIEERKIIATISDND